MTTDRAADHLTADLEPRRGGPLAKAARFLAGILLGALTSDPFAGPATLDIVIRRRESGAVVARTPADVGEPEPLLEQVRADLSAMGVTEFLTEWGYAR